jgi:hypothetical protein
MLCDAEMPKCFLLPLHVQPRNNAGPSVFPALSVQHEKVLKRFLLAAMHHV